MSDFTTEIRFSVTDNKDCLLLSKNKYIKIENNDIYVYCIESFEQDITELLKGQYQDDMELLIEDIERIIDYGIYVLKNKDEYIVGGAFLDTSLSWIEIDNEIVISDSALEIAKKYHFKLSEDVLSTYLILGLPFYPFYTISFWSEISKIKPYNVLKLSSKLVEKISVKSSVGKEVSKEILSKNIRNRMINNIFRQYKKHDSVSCDISGGVDSGTIAYVLKKVSDELKCFHAKSDKLANSDTKWAKYIAKDIGVNLNELSSVEASGKRFNVDDSYIGNIVTDSPLLWADTEGYIEELLKKIPERNIHFVGIGGDELYTPMPSAAWSIVHQEKIRSIIYVFKYSLLMKESFFKCLRELLSNKKYYKELNETIESGFKDNKFKNNSLSWMDAISIPKWLNLEYKDRSYKLVKRVLESGAEPLDQDRSKHQSLESIIFQKKVFSQIKQAFGNRCNCCAPFLDFEVINSSLAIPSRYCIKSGMTKPMLYESLKGIVPERIFIRGVKGDYSDALYEGYKYATDKYKNHIQEFELVKIGIIDSEKLVSELSMPTALQDRIEFFVRVCALERWIRQVNKYMNEE